MIKGVPVLLNWFFEELPQGLKATLLLQSILNHQHFLVEYSEKIHHRMLLLRHIMLMLISAEAMLHRQHMILQLKLI
nr:MAG TPA: hypothetical protein [Bacteriophage sp.]